MSEVTPKTFAHTAAALETYDAKVNVILERFAASEDLEEMERLTVELEHLAESCCRAFYEDTKDVNTLEGCLKLRPGPRAPEAGQPLSWMRRCVATWREETRATC